jgi:hypothetical protein
MVIVASLVTAWIAVKSNDGLVTEDYYKQGLSVDRTLARSREAVELGLEVRVRFSGETVWLSLKSIKKLPLRQPKSLSLTLSHPTRAGLDQAAVLVGNEGEYTGQLHVPASGHWLVLVEDEERTWRLMGNVQLPDQGETVIGGVVSADANK